MKSLCIRMLYVYVCACLSVCLSDGLAVLTYNELNYFHETWYEYYATGGQVNAVHFYVAFYPC